MKTTMNFDVLRKARERMDDSKDGQFGRCGNWSVALGGYDHGYEVYYRNEPIARVNYELHEFEIYNDSIDYADLPEFLAAMDARKFVDITDRGDDDDLVTEKRLPVMWAIDYRDMTDCSKSWS
jgi:hypothetical protein